MFYSDNEYVSLGHHVRFALDGTSSQYNTADSDVPARFIAASMSHCHNPVLRHLAKGTTTESGY